MKKVKVILSTAMIAAAGFTAMTFTSCTPEDKVCPVALTGSNCDQEVRKDFYNTYKGTGTDNGNPSNTYTDWKLIFSERGTNATDMSLDIKDGNNANMLAFDVVLQSNTDYKIVEKTTGGYTYTGYGTISETNASLVLTEVNNTSGTSTTVVYTFASMVKQ